MDFTKGDLRKAISPVLMRHNIDDLAIEAELASAVWELWQRAEAGEDEEQIKDDLVDGFLATHAKIAYRTELLNRICKVFRINIVNEGNWESTLQFLQKREEKGQTIEAFGDWYHDEKFTVPVFKIAQRPAHIQELWPQAFQDPNQPPLPLKVESDGGLDL